MLLAQYILVKPVCLAHQPAQVVAFDSPFEKGLGCPNEDLGIRLCYVWGTY